MPPRLDVDEVKFAARGHWARIACDVGGISDDYLTTQHKPCPKCGGTKPFRVFNDFAETGGAVCSHCGKFGDGIALVQWSLGIEFEEALARVADNLGIQPSNKPKRLPGVSKPRTKSPKKPIETKAEDIVRVEWSEMQVRLWCMRKPPITADALKAAGAFCARYKGKFNVIAVPCGKNWTLYNLSGGKLPGGENEYVKVKNVNKFPGWMRAK